jgi:hypothetical protein
MESLPDWAIKVIGALSGAALALIYDQPKTWGQFWSRLAFSAVVGLALSDAIRENVLHWPANASLAVTLLVGALSWNGYAMAVRIMSIWKPKD